MAMNLLSIGLSATRLNVNVSAILRAAANLGVTATLTLDDVPYFTEEAVETIRGRLHNPAGVPAAGAVVAAPSDPPAAASSLPTGDVPAGDNGLSL